MFQTFSSLNPVEGYCSSLLLTDSSPLFTVGDDGFVLHLHVSWNGWVLRGMGQFYCILRLCDFNNCCPTFGYKHFVYKNRGGRGGERPS